MTSSGASITMSEDFKGLRPAEENPWYLLATINGEIHNELLYKITDKQDKIIRHNRRIWNGFMCRSMRQIDREHLAKKLNISPLELEPWTEEEAIFVKNKLMQRNYFNNIIDDIGDDIYTDFTKTSFEKTLCMDKFIIVNAEFSDSEFQKSAGFINSIFINYARFRSTKFLGPAIFNESTFNYNIEFPDQGRMVSRNATYFEKSEFHSAAIFHKTTFLDVIFFTKCKFKNYTKFKDAYFKMDVPKFYESVFNQDTVFTTNKENWPDPKEDAEGAKNAYSYLRYAMRNQQKPDEEHFFYRQEMAWKAQYEKSPWISWAAINLYGRLSNYGYSLGRPFWAFLITLICPALLVLIIGEIHATGTSRWTEPQNSPTITCALRSSVENMLPLFEFPGQSDAKKCNFPRDNVAWLWDLFSIAQYVLSAVLLFLFALALRTRFRLR